jgi:ribosome-binding protein aMBF1 (putative translation factor)
MTFSATFKTPGGEEMVVLPRQDYERLLDAQEILEDIAAYDLAKSRLASGQDEMIPAEMVNRLIDGENPVRVWRKHRGLSLAELAQRAKLSESYLSQIETGQRKGPVDKMQSLAAVLNVLVDDLI